MRTPIIFIIFATMCIHALSPAADWESFNTEDGLISNQTFGIAIDGEDNVWVSALGRGISRYNGTDWETLSLMSAFALTTDADGNIWAAGGIATGSDPINAVMEAAVAQYTDTGWRIFTKVDGLPESEKMRSIAVDSRGFVWASFINTRGIWRYDGVKWQNMAVDGKLPTVWGVTVDDAGNVWLVTSIGVSKYDGVRWQTFVAPPDKRGMSIAVDKQGNVWIGTPGSGVIHFNGTNWTSFYKEDGLSSPNVWGVAIDLETGYVWAGTEAGANFYDGESWTAITTKDGLIDNIVKSIVFHPNGEIWFGTLAGVSRYRRESVPPDTFITKVIPKPDAFGRIGVDNVFIQFIGGDLATPTESLVYSYRVDDEPWTKPSPETSVSIFGRGVGEHVFQVRAKDKNANVDATPATLAFTIATPDPTAAILYPTND